jgi:hypothetical protein
MRYGFLAIRSSEGGKPIWKALGRIIDLSGLSQEGFALFVELGLDLVILDYALCFHVCTRARCIQIAQAIIFALRRECHVGWFYDVFLAAVSNPLLSPMGADSLHHQCCLLSQL